MKQITGALVGIALVLSAVFVPMAFFGGSIGVIYRQFSITVVVGDGAVGARRADPHAGAVRHHPEAGPKGHGHRPSAASSAGSTATFDRGSAPVPAGIGQPDPPPGRYLVIYLLIVVGAWGAVHPPAHRLPAGGGPGPHDTPDLAAGRVARWRARAGAGKAMEHHFLTDEKDAIESVMSIVTGFNFGSRGQNPASPSSA